MGKARKDPPAVTFAWWDEIKYHETRCEVTLKWQEREGGAEETDTVSKVYHNRPRTPFVQALHELREHVATFITMTQPERKKVIDQLEIRGVQFVRDKVGHAARMIVVRRIPNGERHIALNMNVGPFHTELYNEEEEAEKTSWSPDCVEVLERLQDAAEAYRNGDREPVSELTGRPESEDGPLAPALKGEGIDGEAA